MARPKSFLKSIEIDTAGSSHNCQNNKSHRIHKGDVRLKLKRTGLSPEHFCRECGLQFIQNDIQKLQSIIMQLEQS